MGKTENELKELKEKIESLNNGFKEFSEGDAQKVTGAAAFPDELFLRLGMRAFGR